MNNINKIDKDIRLQIIKSFQEGSIEIKLIEKKESDANSNKTKNTILFFIIFRKVYFFS